MTVNIASPISAKEIKELNAGDSVLISGTIYTARDAAHQRIIQALENKEELPFELKGQTIYYMGPSPAPPGKVIGAAGPTTSRRMDAYTPRLLAAGVKAFIGKGGRSEEVRKELKKHKAVYLATTGGAGALLASAIKEAEVIAYDDLGPEAVMRLVVDNFPAVVANDIYGRDLFEMGKKEYRGSKQDIEDYPQQ
jgi:fumarate hydratase subunit beta